MRDLSLPLPADKLSQPQEAIALSASNSLITACPGAGKTRVIAARASLLRERGARVALTSYTNVGASEIADSLRENFGSELHAEDFCGTLHGLIIKYVLRPFGHVVMGCREVPCVRKGSSTFSIKVDWLEISLDDFRLLQEGGVVVERSLPKGFGWTGPKIAERYAGEVLRLKQEEAASGCVSADDALYWSLRALKEVPQAAPALAMRFEEIIVDEAQDISATLTDLLLEICRSGHLTSLVLIGDMDQSIYSFQGAAPVNVERIATAKGLQRLRLEENFRSSQNLCNVAAKLHDRVAAIAAGPHRACPYAPMIVPYDPSNLRRLARRFSRTLADRDLDRHRSAILARRHSTLALINGSSCSLWGNNYYLLSMLAAAKEVRTGLSRETLFSAEAAVLEMAASASPQAQGNILSLTLRAAVVEWLLSTPETEGNLALWARRASAALEESWACHFGAEWAIPQGWATVPLPRDASKLDVSQVRTSAPMDFEGVTLSTIHGVKGRSLDSVLLIAGVGQQDGGGEAVRWASSFSGGAGMQRDEEIRILYVALTRAERLLIVAVPESCDKDLISQFTDAGFEYRA